MLEARLLEVVKHPLPEDSAGRLLPRSADAILVAAEKADAVAIGPGLGRSDGTVELVRILLERLDKPVVLDADALWELEPFARGAATVLTPHAGELARLLGTESKEVDAHRLEAVRRAASRFGSIVLLKGADTLVAAPREGVLVAGYGTPALATAGSGDVLTGVVAAFLAKGIEPRLAAAARRRRARRRRRSGRRPARARSPPTCCPGCSVRSREKGSSDVRSAERRHRCDVLHRTRDRRGAAVTWRDGSVALAPRRSHGSAARRGSTSRRCASTTRSPRACAARRRSTTRTGSASSATATRSTRPSSARCCCSRRRRRAGVEKIVHVSVSCADRADDLPYFRGKHRIEEWLASSGLDHAIVRPTLVFGPNDILVNNIAWILRRFPLFCDPGWGRVPRAARLAARHRPHLRRRSRAARPSTPRGRRRMTLRELVAALARRDRREGAAHRRPARADHAAHAAGGRLLRDVIVTRDELAGLSRSLLISGEEPLGRDRFTEWVPAHAATLGRSYVSELKRNFRGQE